jgi:hypothetical protein
MWWLVAGCDDGTSALRGALEREGFEVVGLAVGESGALSWTAQRDGQVCQGVAKGLVAVDRAQGLQRRRRPALAPLAV